MKIKWYWLAEQLGLVTDLTAQYNDGAIHYRVSAQVSEVFFVLLLSLIPLLFLLGLALCFFLPRSGRELLARRATGCSTLLLAFYGLLLAFGAAPYLLFYPQGGSFISFRTLENILRGLYTTLLALSLFLGGKTGRFWANRCTKRTETPG